MKLFTNALLATGLLCSLTTLGQTEFTVTFPVTLYPTPVKAPQPQPSYLKKTGDTMTGGLVLKSYLRRSFINATAGAITFDANGPDTIIFTNSRPSTVTVVNLTGPDIIPLWIHVLGNGTNSLTFKGAAFTPRDGAVALAPVDSGYATTPTGWTSYQVQLIGDKVFLDVLSPR